VNLLEIDNSIAGRVPGLEGRFGRKYLDSRDLGVSHWRYAPGTRNPGGHSHREQEEAYVVVAGSGRVRLDDEVRDIRLWDVIRVPPRSCAPSKPGPTASS
jgi:mannose-6-phosphate isomerase-like protein (cupin superfamily)